MNLVVIDYSELVKYGDGSNLAYAQAFANLTVLGQPIAQYLRMWVKKVQPREQIQLVGHSLGAQIMSQTAKFFGIGCLRLTGLDPAYPLCAPPICLNAADGSFVDVIHTDVGNYGATGREAHADFFPNNGTRPQPHCIPTETNSLYIFISIINDDRFFKTQ